jgi:mannosyl-3-phosphoglycerate phosphatase
MTFQAIMSRTGLTLEQAIQARQREYDEPFFIDTGDGNTLLTALRANGLTVTRGDRFFHVTGGHDKGGAVKTLLGYYRRQHPSLFVLGLGNSANDLSLMRETDMPVLVRNLDGSWDAEVTTRLPTVKRTDGIGPAGWREAIDSLLDPS